MFTGPYHLTLMEDSRYVFEAEKWIALPFVSQTML